MRRGNVEVTAVAAAGVKIFEDIDFDGTLPFNKSLHKDVVADYRKLQHLWIDDENYLATVLGKLANENKFLLDAGKSRAFVKGLWTELSWLLILSDFNEAIKQSLPHLLEQENLEYFKVVKELCDTALEERGVNCKKILLLRWGAYVQARTEALVSPASRIELVPAVVRVQRTLSGIVLDALADDSFDYEIRTSMSRVLSERKYLFVVLTQLSRYCDAYMKNKMTKSFEEFEADVITVFKLINNKRDFAVIYARELSKRMIMGKVFQRDREKAIVTSLVSLMGEGDEGYNLKAMFRDLEKSESEFSSMALNSAPGLEFSALVLEKKCWPEIPNQGAEVQLPEIFKDALTDFTVGYRGADDKLVLHKLDWTNYALHQVVIEVQFDNGAKELSTNLLQATVLMLFGEVDVMDYAEIVSLTQMEGKLLKRVLASLSSSRYPILQIQGRAVRFNHSYSDKLAKIRLPMGKEKEIAIDEFPKAIEKSRQSEIRCAVTRIMKKERKMTYLALIGQCIKELEAKGGLHIPSIKAEVEYLIANEFVRRDDDGVTLHYIP